MTDQPYTPTTEQVRFAATFPNENFSLKGSDFDRWLATIEAAAEQRGAVSALREAAIEISVRDGSTARGIIWSDRDSIVSWLHNRADQTEGDE